MKYIKKIEDFEWSKDITVKGEICDDWDLKGRRIETKDGKTGTILNITNNGMLIVDMDKTLSENNIKAYEDFGGGEAYPGPSVVGPDNKQIGGTIGGPGFGQTGAMGGEYPKKYAPPSPEKTPYKQNIKSLKTKETKKRRNAIQKIKRLDMLSFNDFKNKKEEK